MAKLVVFDIDGTLTKTNGLDAYAYLQAVRHYISADFAEFDPYFFTHYTDSSMVVELYQKLLDKTPTNEEVSAFKAYYLELVQQAFIAQPQAFSPVEGANEILTCLPSDWDIALATGCWEASALLKLEYAGVNAALPLPKGTADDAVSRADIMKSAFNKAKLKANEYEKIVYVGDGIWDVRTCLSLGVPIIGIEAEGDLKKRELLGQHWLLTDYTDKNKFIDLLEGI